MSDIYIPISIHAPIVGCDVSISLIMPSILNFNPRTHRGVRLGWFTLASLIINISIHAPIVGCDACILRLLITETNFNPRTHRGVRPSDLKVRTGPGIFQSTHPSWGATVFPPSSLLVSKFQSTHPSWGATLLDFLWHSERHISIHAPIVGCDLNITL